MIQEHHGSHETRRMIQTHQVATNGVYLLHIDLQTPPEGIHLTMFEIYEDNECHVQIRNAIQHFASMIGLITKYSALKDQSDV